MTDNQQDIQALRTRVEQLQELVTGRTRSNRSKRKLVWILGGALAVVSTVSLFSLSRTARRLDAQSVAQLTRIELENRIPGMRLAYQEYLVREAPRLVNQAMRGLLDILPHMRGLVVQGLNKKLELINAEFEKRAVANMTDAIHKSRNFLDKIHPTLGEREKLELLVNTVAANFETNVGAAIGELYPSYAAEMDRIRTTLRHLRTSDAADLTREERIKKDILKSLLQLVLRNHDESQVAVPR